MPSFIETQFPIARLSAESYKERKAGASQTLTGLGKWWGRKPLVLVRAAIVGMLMPASNDPKRDREVFLKILTMDDDGAWDRCKPPAQRKLGRAGFGALPYAERITNCDRPENVSGPSTDAWADINAHLGTTANSLPELIDELGQRAFGHRPRVGDSFCGGGSIPFEAARIGCDAFGSDLNPVAGLLTWASLNLLGGGSEVQSEVADVLTSAFNAADRQITNWGIEHNANGERAEAYLYCVEVRPEGCDYYIPLAPSWAVSDNYNTVVRWKHSTGSNRLVPDVYSAPDSEYQLYKAKKGATIVDGRVVDPFNSNRTWSVESLRGPEGLRRWTSDDICPRTEDVFQERLYCIRWVDSGGNRRFAAPDADDLAREARVLALLRERFEAWQREGFIPSLAIAPGYNTEQPIRERGWTHWHHLFTPRQMLTYGAYLAEGAGVSASQAAQVALLLKIGVQANWNSKLCTWNGDKSKGPGSTDQTFVNQALNTLFNYGTKSFGLLQDSLLKPFGEIDRFQGNVFTQLIDAREIGHHCDIWITDPPYADAINYHELGDFFLSWYAKRINHSFPQWIPDARAELAVRGDGEDFRRSMVDIYRNLARHMPDNGFQMVMFTHQNPSVWADLGMILWASGLKATAAWTISTETQAGGIKKGNYVQGTVCLVLRKRVNNEPGFLDEVYPLVEDEVKHQIAGMQALDEGGEPNFNDA
ncbi:MAG: DUF1156 domain-containing protein, partial [Betaproteobacteria bacterium]|nr:DUF1156 domain-containing protein [Betaproteobacteria bacterium]